MSVYYKRKNLNSENNTQTCRYQKCAYTSKQVPCHNLKPPVTFTKEPIQTEPQNRGAQIKFCTSARSDSWVLSMEHASCHPSDALNFEVPLDFVKTCAPLFRKACNLKILNSGITATTSHLKNTRSRRRTAVLTQ